jgi:hypothetical protein
MRIIGFNFNKISAERKEGKKGKINVNSNIDIKDVEEEDFKLSKKEKALKFNFEFSIKYKPKTAEISFQGFVVSLFNKKDAKEVLDKWKDKKIPDKIRIPLFNLILTKCNLKALTFEEEFGLPTHIPMPRIKKPEEKKKAKYTG